MSAQKDFFWGLGGLSSPGYSLATPWVETGALYLWLGASLDRKAGFDWETFDLWVQLA